jgi:hypothetical protein
MLGWLDCVPAGAHDAVASSVQSSSPGSVAQDGIGRRPDPDRIVQVGRGCTPCPGLMQMRFSFSSYSVGRKGPEKVHRIRAVVVRNAAR